MEHLINAEINKEYIFIGYNGSSPYEKHLSNLGLVQGTPIKVMSAVKDQQLIIFFKGNRVGIDGKVADTMLVQEKGDDETSEHATLNQLSVGDTGIVKEILGQRNIKRRLMDMGLTRGTPIMLMKIAPLGDPIEIKVRGFELSLRKNEAELIIIEKG